jgi:hypothetical protein
MPVEFDLNGYSDAGVGIIAVRIHLEDDMSWSAVGGSEALKKEYHFPAGGSWHVVQATPLPKNVGLTSIFRGTLVLNVPNLVGVGIFLGEFFPAQVGKSGRGTATGGQGGAFPTTKVTWRITLAEDFIGDDFSKKFSTAVELAKGKFVSKLGPAFYNALKDPIFLALLAANFVKKPGNWLKLLKNVGGKVLALWTMVQLAYQFNGILMDIDAAQTKAQLAACGDALAEFFAGLAAQIPLQLLLEGVRKWRDAEPVPESKDRTPEKPAAEPPPANYRSWRDGIRGLEAEADKLVQAADPSKPAQYIYKLERAAGLRMQIAWWRLFVIETAHHIEWLRKAGPEVQKMAAKVREIVNEGGSTRAYPVALKWLRSEMRNAGIPWEGANMNAWMELIRALDICGDIDWSAHDTESWLTNKFNEIVSGGLKNPFNFREMPGLKEFTKGWTEEQYRDAASGYDPRAGHKGQRITSKTVIEIFGNTLGPKFLEAFGRPGEVFNGVFDAEKGYKQHTTSEGSRQAPDHHQPSGGMKKLPKDAHPYGTTKWGFTNWPDNARFSRGMLERGADVAHAMLQLRFYRVFIEKKPFTFDAVAQEFKNDPYVLFGLLIFKKFSLNDVMDPGNVSPETLKAFGMGDLILEARSIATGAGK